MSDASPLEGPPIPADVLALVERLHATSGLAVLAVTGAGSLGVAWLLGVGGASRTVLEATVPYAAAAFEAYAGGVPAEFASEDAASRLAVAALARARRFAPAALEGGVPLVGVGCAAAIATDRTKRGDHRAYVAAAIARPGDTSAGLGWGVVIEKGARDRAAEEALVSRVVLRTLAQACGLEEGTALDLGLRPGEVLQAFEVAQ